MFLGAALKLCPDLKTIPYDFEGYQEVAKTLYDTVASYTLDIQVFDTQYFIIVDVVGIQVLFSFTCISNLLCHGGLFSIFFPS
jgi:hypothetical protein